MKDSDRKQRLGSRGRGGLADGESERSEPVLLLLILLSIIISIIDIIINNNINNNRNLSEYY